MQLLEYNTADNINASESKLDLIEKFHEDNNELKQKKKNLWSHLENAMQKDKTYEPINVIKAPSYQDIVENQKVFYDFLK